MALATESLTVETLENLTIPLKEDRQENAPALVSMNPVEKSLDVNAEKASKSKRKVSFRQRKKNPPPTAEESSQDSEKAVAQTSPVEKSKDINPESTSKLKRKLLFRNVKAQSIPSVQADNKQSEPALTSLNPIEELAEMNEEKAAKSSPKISLWQAKPGRLMNEAKIILQTRLAQYLFLGQHHGAVGLGKFSHLVLKIWESASQDDPYADLFLLRIYDDLVTARKALQQTEREYQPLLSSEPGVELQVALTEEPLKIPLRSLTPYGFMGAYLLADFDRLVRLIVSAKYLGLIIDQVSDGVLFEKARLVKKTFARPLHWKYTGITRKDVEQHNAIAQRAFEIMGKLPEAVLTCALRAPHAPYIKQEGNSHEK